MANSFQELENQMRRELAACMKEIRTITKENLEDNVSDFYTGDPEQYVRTGTLLESPTVTPVSIGLNSCSFKAYMDEGIEYNTGTYTGAEVLDATEYSHSGVIGTGGYWAKTEAEIPDTINRVLGSHFK